MTTEKATPFATRQGHSLAWENARVTLRKDNRCILQGVSGRVLPRSLTCFIGHSGSGKTTLLNLLAGKLTTGSDTIVEKKITLDGVHIDPVSIGVKRKIAFVAQRDTLLPTATAREALTFSATLRLPRETPKEEVDSLVDQLLKELRLEAVADTIIGGEHFRGMSGGEMRRVSLGVELVVQPSVVLLDEVTSGLDSHNAKTVMEVCKDVAKSGAAVVMTLHQPSSAIFNLIDHVMLMSQGHCLYAGPAAQMPGYFSERGYPIKANYNPADWAIEVSQTAGTKALTEAGFGQDLPTSIEEEMLTADKYSDTDDSSDSAADDSESNETLQEDKRVSWWKELQLQLVRDLLNLKRDKRAMMLRFIIVIVGSALISVVFQGVGGSDFRSRVGTCFFLVLVNVISLQIILLDFINQRPLFVREFATNHFRMPSYGLTKIAMEATSTFFQVLVLVLTTYWSLELTGRFWYILLTLFLFAMVCTSMGVLLASATSDPRDAKELIPVTILPQLLLCGFFVNVDALPSWLQWAQWLFPLTYTFRLFIGEEFRDCLDDPVAKCLAAFNNVGATANIYSETSVLEVPEVGNFVGVKGIPEYTDFFHAGQWERAGFWDTCTVQGSAVVQFNAAEDGFCDFTFGTITQGRNNENIARDDKSPWYQVTRGGRLTYTYSEDLQSVSVDTFFTYLAESLIGDMVNEIWNNTAVAEKACETMSESCPDVSAANGFSSTEECLASMETLPLSEENELGYQTFDSNSSSCRYVHAALAATNPEVHCPHVSFVPFEDEKGQIKCSESRNIDKKDRFGPGASQVFEQTASRFGWKEGQEIAYNLDESSLKPCDDHLGFAVSEVHLLGLDQLEDQGENLVCRNFLEAQKATGEHQTQYWLALVGFFVVFRGLALILLRNKTK